MFLSVIIPTCNAADWLEEQLRAFAGQTRLPDEILVVDSASSRQCRVVVAVDPFRGILRERPHVQRRRQHTRDRFAPGVAHKYKIVVRYPLVSVSLQHTTIDPVGRVDEVPEHPIDPLAKLRVLDSFQNLLTRSEERR